MLPLFIVNGTRRRFAACLGRAMWMKSGLSELLLFLFENLIEHQFRQRFDILRGSTGSTLDNLTIIKLGGWNLKLMSHGGKLRFCCFLLGFDWWCGSKFWKFFWWNERRLCRELARWTAFYRRSNAVLTAVLPPFSRWCELPFAKVSSYILMYRT